MLIGSASAKEGPRVEELDVSEIRPNPRQPRKRFEKEALDDMARSVEAFGVVQPILVRPVGTEYEIVAGERRWRAAKAAGIEKIPAVIRESSETASLEMALIENIHRADLNGIEEATAYEQLLDDFGITHEELSQRVGKSRASITNTLRLLKLPPLVQKALVEDRVTTGHARALLALQEQAPLQEALVMRILNEGLSVRQVEAIVQSYGPGAEEAGPGAKAARAKEPPPEEVLDILRELGEMLDTRVKASVGKRKGRITIEFTDIEDLRRIYSLLAAGGPPTVEDAAPEGREV